MIDWLTVHVRWREDALSDWERWCERWGQWARLVQGELVGYRYDWERLRSDSREVSVIPRPDGVTLCGSPAVAAGARDNVFGLEGLAALHAVLRAGFEGLAARGWTSEGLIRDWRVTRCDYTFNVLLESAEQCARVLDSIGGIETGRYRTTRKYGTSCYTGGKSRTKRGKLYNKGAHLRKMLKMGKLQGITEGELAILDRVLRLELEFGRDWWDGKHYEDVCNQIEAEAVAYWDGLFGDIGDIRMDCDEYTKVLSVAKSEREARAAFRTLELIRVQGALAASVTVSRATWFRHLRVLRKAGFGEVTLSGGARVLVFPARQILGCRVDSWDELWRAA